MTIPLILGSVSPRRKKILRALGCTFTVATANTDEIHDAADPVHTVVTNALEKYRACRRRHPEAALITADTLVWFEGRLIGKPADIDEAAQFLRAFSGRTPSACKASRRCRGSGLTCRASSRARITPA